ncbi:hypothetical protein ADUPG1_010343 [Aduncisulcus paluster]|uniref:Uncharacterized protein n=1 Tax=Aduncisulcus paluster TaxID=2918883 RepID=A0ABQ5JQZ9_9EUKA|nr:hypothetical protein ADUPG1_010343 [Aduncisulcus paluster]
MSKSKWKDFVEKYKIYKAKGGKQLWVSLVKPKLLEILLTLYCFEDERDDIVLTEDEMTDSVCFASIYDGKKIGIENDGAEKLLRKVNKAYAPSSTVALYDALKILTMKTPQYRARGGAAHLFTMIELDVLPIYCDATGAVLTNPDEDACRQIQDIRTEERTFIKDVQQFFGTLSGLDALYAFEEIKLTKISVKSVAVYVKAFRKTLRRVTEDERPSGFTS